MSNATCVCPSCGGSGRVPIAKLPPHLQEVFDWLNNNGPATTNEIHQAVGAPQGIRNTATINRLKSLLDNGQIKRKSVNAPGGGRYFSWYVLEQELQAASVSPSLTRPRFDGRNSYQDEEREEPDDIDLSSLDEEPLADYV